MSNKITIKKIGAIKFGILSPDIVRKMSAVKVVTADTYDKDGYPFEAGLMDLHMGVIDPGLRCKTCGHSMARCPGHFGSIEIVRPVLHVGYVKEVYTLLKASCRKCGRLLIPKEELMRFKELMLATEEEVAEDILENIRKVSKCPHCGEKQENVKLMKPTTFYEGKKKLLPSEIRERLSKIPDKDLSLLGFDPSVARPEWMIITVLPVPPVTVRPSITLETGERSEDDITHKLVDILRINQRLRDNIAAGAPQLIIEDLWELLQYHVTTYISNEVSGIPPARHRSGRPLKTLSQRLKGKEGRFRYNLSGKRVNFSARTVISPDPSIGINQVGVPEAITQELTIPEPVTEWNLEQMKQLVGSDTHTVNYVIRQDGLRKKVTDFNRADILEELAAGYVVERQIQDGDIVLFNRQPSLHTLSMLAHEVKILPGRTFRLNTCVCPPYNADFDGDEMNLHVPQTEEARAEAKFLMHVQNHILSVRNGRPIIVGEHDHVTGAFFLTQQDTMVTRKELMDVAQFVGLDKIPKGEDMSGKDLFSSLLPGGLNITYKNSLCQKCEKCLKANCPHQAYVTIRRGRLKTGAIEKRALAGPLLAKIFKNYGPEYTREFLDRGTRLFLYFALKKGFTTGIGDSDLSEEAQKEILDTLKKAENEVLKLIESFRRGELEVVPGKTERETLEDMIMAILGNARNETGKIAAKYLDPENHALLMAKVGARGNLLNLTQMMACVGQQAVRAKRILRGFKGRTLPHFETDDLSAPARGFVESSFKTGLTPIEYFFHAMGGREGLVDKGIRTAKSGYMQRRLINALMDISMCEDGTVRDSASTIVQFDYGEDGVDPLNCIKGDFFDPVKYFPKELESEQVSVGDRDTEVEVEEEILASELED